MPDPQQPGPDQPGPDQPDGSPSSNPYGNPYGQQPGPYSSSYPGQQPGSYPGPYPGGHPGQPYPQGYPQAYPTAYPQIGGPQAPDPRRQRRQKTMAAWALGLGVLPLCGVGWFVSVGLAITVLVGRARGAARGMAIGALVASTVWLLVAVGGLAWLVVDQVSGPERGDDGQVTRAEDTTLSFLREGDCFSDLGDSDTVDEVRVIPCDEPHQLEVVGIVDIAEGGEDYPGARASQRRSDAACIDAFEAYTGEDYDYSPWGEYTLWPGRSSWESGDSTAFCTAGDPSGDEVTGRLADGSAVAATTT
ncbi:septum formation family protein [Nocardioides sp. GY 10127]|uniref:septum formation family protein n=1 Tax=Nocardioides sp. GY 10127 TaxID=2569762 RepID=UPI0010A9347E|nr:septum formation family protein [Nocardioides sp. GY 10127]TIC80755.1 hypothetical protein E8D37_12820 [Nocardioides sp. GY 10127]